MAIPKIDKLSYGELLELESRVEAALSEKRAAEKRKIRREAAALAAEAGFTLREVASKKPIDRRRGKVPIKYRNPKNPSQTWTGRGRMPLWLAAELADGKSLETFKV